MNGSQCNIVMRSKPSYVSPPINRQAITTLMASIDCAPTAAEKDMTYNCGRRLFSTYSLHFF